MKHDVVEPVLGQTPETAPANDTSASGAAPKHDEEMARKFLAGLDPNADRFTFQFFGDRGGRHAEVFHGTLDEVWPKVLALNTPEQGVGVFVTIAETDFQGRKVENIVRSRALFADADGKEQVTSCTTALKSRGVCPSMVVNSGRGAHVYFCTDVPLNQFTPLQKSLAAKLGTDGAVKDLPRVMRLPGTLHLKDPASPRLVKLVVPGDEPVQRWRLPDLMCKLGLSLGAADEEAKQHDTAGSVKGAQQSPNLARGDCVRGDVTIPADVLRQKPAAEFASIKEESLASGIKDYWFGKLSPGQKDEVVDYAAGIIAERTNLLKLTAIGGDNLKYYAITTAIAVSGAPRAEDIFVKYASAVENADDDAVLREHFARCKKDADGRITVGTLILWARQAGGDFSKWKHQALATPALPQVVWTPADLQVSFANIPHRRWLYGTYLIRGEITVLAAPGGAGKTALATGIAIEIAAGVTKLGETLWKSADQKVLYINGEDSRIEIARRLYAFCLEHKLSEQDLARVMVAAADDPRVQSMSFLRVNERTAVLNEDGFNGLQAALGTLRPDLVVLDPLVVFCGGGNMNDNAVMSLIMRRLKALAVRFDCAMLVVHHTRKGRSTGDGPAEEAERIGGAAAIVNLARRAIMPVTMTDAETKAYAGSVLPSERFKYFKLADVKSNLAPLSTEAPWYELASVELPNAEPPTYPHGDRVQAVKRVHLTRQKAGSPLNIEQLTIRFELMKLIDRGATIEGETAPYSPNSTGKNNQRAILDNAMAAVERATPDREWFSKDLRATVERELEVLKQDGWVIVEKIKTGRFRRSHGLRPVWERTPWAKERENLQQHGGPTVRTAQEIEQLEESDRRDCLEKAGRSMGQ
jgi:hypothetical protein